MYRLLLILLFTSLITRATAQCGYTATLRTNKDYCVGSSLIVDSKHTLQRIVWYKDGQRIDSALANQSFPSTPLKKQVNGIWPATSLVSDESGVLYTFTITSDKSRIIKWDPRTGATSDVSDGVNKYGDAITNGVRLAVDHAGNVYLSSQHPNQVAKFTPGNRDGIVVATSTDNNYNSYGTGLAVDCAGNVFVGNEGFDISRWSPGATSGMPIVGGSGIPVGQSTLTYIAQLAVDTPGNIYALNGQAITQWTPGNANSHTLTAWNIDNFGATDMFLDGTDTAWMIGWYQAGPFMDKVTIWKCAPGSTQPQVVGNIMTGSAAPPSVTMDPEGNLWATIGSDGFFYEWPRSSNIDSAFTPTATGVYYAIVTDMRGYAARTNPIPITVPSTGTPGITISATAISTPICTPITFTASPQNPGTAPSYQWMVSGVPVGDGSLTYSNNLFADSDQVYCILNTLAGCTGTVSDTSNRILLQIDPQGAATVKISTPKDSICIGDPVVFTATVTNGSNTPTFEWLVNGNPATNPGPGATPATGPSFTPATPANGDVITCIITSDDACGLAKSNSIPLTISTPPSIPAGQVFTILHGHNETLEPVITGDVDSWLWTPATGLSDPTVADPVASPDSNMLYTLTVGAPGGCTATGTILVNVFIPLSIPGAFTPNGDGNNDLFYVLGGPINSRIEDFGVFNRFGGEVFQAHNVTPGDPTHAWNGYGNGHPAPPGTYVYFVRMKFADGHTQTYKGTVILIR